MMLLKGGRKMLLCIKQKGRRINEMRFKKGPIYLGRQMGSQVFLPERSVSRQHAVIYTDQKDKWVIEDLDSANKTLINKEAIHKIDLKDGDNITIGEFTIEFNLDEEQETKKRKPSIHLDDTVAQIRPDIHAEIRIPNARNAPLIKIPAKRARDIYRAAKQINNSHSIKDLHSALTDILIAQFASHSVWVSLRKDLDGEMDIEDGRKKTREHITHADLLVHHHIKKAMEKQKYILISQLPRQIADGKIRSVIIAPILAHRNCHGMLYANNSKEHEHYEMADLDYLIMIAAITAAAIENL